MIFSASGASIRNQKYGGINYDTDTVLIVDKGSNTEMPFSYKINLNLVDNTFTLVERDMYFGKAPSTVWENIQAFDKYPEKLEIFKRDDVMTEMALESYREAILDQWKTELHNRIIPDTMDLIRACSKAHDDLDCVDFDRSNWEKIQRLRNQLGRDTLDDYCLLTQVKRALDDGDYDAASELQLEMQEKVQQLTELYITYKKNLF